MENYIQAAILITGIVGQLYVCQRNHRGFYWWIASNLLLMTVSLKQEMYGMFALYIFFTAMCVISIYKWRKLDNSVTPAQAVI